jgi:hypothetical protein
VPARERSLRSKQACAAGRAEHVALDAPGAALAARPRSPSTKACKAWPLTARRGGPTITRGIDHVITVGDGARRRRQPGACALDAAEAARLGNLSLSLSASSPPPLFLGFSS